MTVQACKIIRTSGLLKYRAKAPNVPLLFAGSATGRSLLIHLIALGGLIELEVPKATYLATNDCLLHP